ncbi:hypothetical protein Tco_0593115 [Tanacetum coccineum]
MSNQQDIYAVRAERLAKAHDPLALMANTQTPFHPDQPSHITYMQHPQPNNNYVQQPPLHTNYMQQLMPNLEDISDPTTAIDMALVLMAKEFKLNNTRPTNNNQRSSSNPRNKQISQSGMNTGQDRQMLMVDDNIGNQFRQNAWQIAGKQNGISNQKGNGNVVEEPAKGNDNGNNGNQIRCYNCQGVGHYSRNYTVKPWKRDAAYLQTQLQIAQKEEAGIQLNPEEFDFMATAGAYEEIEEVNMDQVSVEHSGGTVEQQPATVEEIRAYFELLYNNLVNEVEKVNMVNRKMKETNVDLTTKLARYRGQEKCFEINKANFDELETKKSIVSLLQEENKKLKSDFKTREDKLLDKLIQSEKKIKELDKILVKMGQSIQTMHMLSPKPDSFYHTEQKMALGYHNPFYLKQAQQKQRSLYNARVLLEKHDPPVAYDSEETLQLAQESHLKMKQLNKEIKLENYAKINKLSEVFVFQKAKSRKEVYFSNTSKMAVFQTQFPIPISIPDEEYSDDTPSVA